MKLRGIDFGNVLCGSSALGFFGNDFWYEQKLPPEILNQITLVTKTVTLLGNKGNMPLRGDSTPDGFYPECIKIHSSEEMMLVAVALSNLGLGYYLGDERWQNQDKPFMISLASLGLTPDERLNEYQIMANMINLYKDKFSAPFGIQINPTCPTAKNQLTKISPTDFCNELMSILHIMSIVEVPLEVKLGLTSTTPALLDKLNKHPCCDSICLSNSIPWGSDIIDWEKVWGSEISLLADLRGGGLTGRHLLEENCRVIKEAREIFKKPISASGGVLDIEAVDKVHQAGANSIALCSVLTLKPENVPGIIEYANSLDWG